MAKDDVPAEKDMPTTPSDTAVTEKKRPAMRAPISAFVAEAIGTFMLAAIVINMGGNQLGVMFALIAIVLVVGHLSGAHVNPAITFGAWVTRQISGIRALGYIVAQFVGAMLAVVTLSSLLGGVPAQVDFTGASTDPELFKAQPLVEGKEWYAFFSELLGASIFGFAVAAAFKHKNRMAAAFTVGGGLFVALYIGGVTTVLNPAVALSIEALQFNHMMPIAVYAIATMIGGGIGFLLYKLLRTNTEQEPTGSAT